jgi:hypothetical protein
MVAGQPGEKISKIPISTNETGMVVQVHGVISGMWEAYV